jgi:hypothetical protein
MKLYAQKELVERFAALGFIWPKFHLIGTRSKVDKPNAFDDVFYLITGQEMKIYSGTTNPGVYWQGNFDSKKGGVAVLKPGQHLDKWALGLHHGDYEAWVQVRPLTVYRDSDNDGKSEVTAKEDTGLFGINVHRANEKWTSTVIDKWSAGCQVFNNPVQYNEFITLSRKTGHKFFTYTLLEEF